MEQRLIDNPVNFLLRLAIGLRHENLDANREAFILEAINLTRNQAANLWDNEIYNSWGEACTLQVMAQILATDIITISKDSCSVQTFKGSKMRHEPLMLLHHKNHYLPIEPMNDNWQENIFEEIDPIYYHKQFQNKDLVTKKTKMWNADTKLSKNSDSHSLYDWYEVGRKRKRNRRKKSIESSTSSSQSSASDEENINEEKKVQLAKCRSEENQIIDSTDCVKDFPYVETSHCKSGSGCLSDDNEHALSTLELKYQTHSSKGKARHCETHGHVGLKMESEIAGSQTSLDMESGTTPDRENIES